MRIVVVESDNLDLFREYLKFNQLNFESDSLWDENLDSFGRHTLDRYAHDSKTLLILNSRVFQNLCNWDKSLKQIIQFCNNKNKIWIWNDLDSIMALLFHRKELARIDALIPSGSIKHFTVNKISDRLKMFDNIELKTLPTSYSLSLFFPRIPRARCDKHNCLYDFFITTVLKKVAPHRSVLYKQIHAIEGLPEKGRLIFNRLNLTSHNYVGQKPSQNIWAPGYPAMDLYLNSWLEIVPETYYKNGYYLTEKTFKPICTKTPFLIVASCQYLQYLKSLGFKTFESLIDESYDLEYRVEDRVKLMLEQLQFIVKNGSESFYKESLPILEHNQAKLLELNGRRQFELDSFITDCLEQDGYL